MTTATPARIQRRRLKGWRAPAGARYVGRGTRWGNPWVVVQIPTGWAVNWVPGTSGPKPPAADQWRDAPDRHTAHAAAVELFAAHLAKRPKLIAEARIELRGRDLMCWCPPELACHVDVLLEIANSDPAAAVSGSATTGQADQ